MQFSFVGMQAVEEAVNGRSTIDVVMVSSAIGLDEVVVTALGIQREKKTLTYASQQVEGEELMKARGANFMENLSGKTAGLEIDSEQVPHLIWLRRLAEPNAPAQPAPLQLVVHTSTGFLLVSF